MIESRYAIFGGRSPAQSKNGLITTPIIMCAAESASFVDNGSPNSYANNDGSQSISPHTAFAYGSINNLFGFARKPCPGSYAPCTRYPYRCPGCTCGR